MSPNNLFLLFTFAQKTMKTGIHITPCNIGECEKHNRRDKNYIEGVKKSGRGIYIFQDQTKQNQSKTLTWGHMQGTNFVASPEYDYTKCSIAQLFAHECELYKQKIGRAPMLKDRIRVNKKTGKQKTISGWSPIREGVIPIKADTQLTDFDKITAWLAGKDIHTIRIDLHHDEGYEDDEGKRKYNHHAHIVMDYLDHATGKTVKLSKEDIEELQGVVADALGMDRGEKKAVTGAKHLSPAEYRQHEAEKKANEAEIRASEAVIKTSEAISRLDTINAKITKLSERITFLKNEKSEIEREVRKKLSIELRSILFDMRQLTEKTNEERTRDIAIIQLASCFYLNLQNRAQDILDKVNRQRVVFPVIKDNEKDLDKKRVCLVQAIKLVNLPKIEQEQQQQQRGFRFGR